ncbi:MAG: DUF3540 domain-containing protein [Pseudomonadota bacterium]
MDNISVLSNLDDADAVYSVYGRVIGRAGGKFRVLITSGQVLDAEKADGCLLVPEENDLVLAARGPDRTNYILHVLKKYSSQGEVALPGETKITAPRGLELEADRVALSGRREVELRGPEINLEAVKGRARFLDFSFLAGRVQAGIKDASTEIMRHHSIIGRLTQKITSSYRWVKNLEQTRAGRMTFLVRDRWLTKAGSAALTAESEVKIDGEKINLG